MALETNPVVSKISVSIYKAWPQAPGSSRSPNYRMNIPAVVFAIGCLRQEYMPMGFGRSNS